jgi:hypothetical protein
MKKIIRYIILFSTLAAVFDVDAQQNEGIYHKPLTELLAKVENIYHVKFQYKNDLVKGVNVYTTDGFTSNLESTLDNILKPLGLIYTKTSANTYTITEFEAAHRYTEAQGAKHLEKLLTLYSNANEFDARKKELRECIIKTLGIDPRLKGGPLHAIMRPPVMMNGYTVQNVAFESIPGYYVTGSLYKPARGKGPFPVILSPHGHFYSETDRSISQDSGRYAPDMQTYCAGLGKMGAIVFIYDMYSWGESALESGGHAFHYTPFAEAIQTWNSIRSLDFLLSLPQADKKRVGVMGASGGGTQTILVAALDDRITSSVPVVMVSSSFDGGCECESGLPIHGCGKYKTNNAEIAALTAPRPQLVISEDADWTRSVPGTDYPYLKKVYGFYGREANIENVHLHDKHHDFRITKRIPMYKFFARTFGLNLNAITDKNGNIDESGITIQNYKDLLVFGKERVLPSNALRSNAAIMREFKNYFSR